MYENILELLKKKPFQYQQGEKKFWDDEHISKSMLEAHLNPEVEAASRKHVVIEKSTRWIAELVGLSKGKKLLDLGCGPGIYTEKFYDLGFEVTGVDFSKRSIAYAIDSAKRKKKSIEYNCQDYREIKFENQFDIATMIYCDYGVLNEQDRSRVLNNVFLALKPNGILILDAWTKNQYNDFYENQKVIYEKGGFWKDVPYGCIQRNYRYEEEKIFLEQYIIICENESSCYNIWNKAFDKQELSVELQNAGFIQFELYSDIAGSHYNDNSNTICIVARK